ncbi:glycoside hydrolase superfamily [Coniochaeta sp. 2T2.1]|nr:glycoside hydrolase superfamily [Coniochaeta sp. 2T2.1]
MKLTLLLFAATALAAPSTRKRRSCNDVRDKPVIREGSSLLLDGKPWKAVGANVYWLGLDENVTPPAGEPYYAPLKASYPTKGRITEAMAVIQAMGGTMIRSHTLGVSTGNPLSVMPSLGVVNEQAFDPIDWAVYQARQHGIRLMVPLTDQFQYYHGGRYDFLRWNGFNLTQAKDSSNPQIQQFFTNATIVASVKDYIHKLLTHINRYTNISYAEDPTIFAYETGNELCGPVWGDMNVPASWVQEIGSYVKSLAPKKLFVDGTYGVNKTHLAIPEVDIFSNHYYPISLSKLKGDLDLVASVNKTYFAGEYDWLGQTSSGAPNGDSLSTWYRTIEQTPGAIGSAFWSLFGHNVPDCTVRCSE